MKLTDNKYFVESLCILKIEVSKIMISRIELDKLKHYERIHRCATRYDQLRDNKN